MTTTRYGAVQAGQEPQLRAVLEQVLWCWLCGGDRVFEAPGCTDEHGVDVAECPERLCVDCGAAVLLAVAESAGQGRRSA